MNPCVNCKDALYCNKKQCSDFLVWSEEIKTLKEKSKIDSELLQKKIFGKILSKGEENE